jgi:hypothetical protein
MKSRTLTGSALTHKDIQIGIVGANAKAGWAKLSHIPAINGLPGLKLAAVATRNGAQEAAEAFGAERWFSDPFAMICDEQIDLITIAVKLPAHREFLQVRCSAAASPERPSLATTHSSMTDSPSADATASISRRGEDCNCPLAVPPAA